MRRNRLIPRLAAFSLIFPLTQPSSALALRGEALPEAAGMESLDQTLRTAAGAEEERVSLEEATQRILSNPDGATRVWFETATFPFFGAENWPTEEEIRQMLGQMMKAAGDTDALFISLRNVLEEKTLWVRAAAVPPNLLAYHQRLADEINANGLFRVSLLQDGSVFLLSLPEGKHSFFGTEHVYLLHYDSQHDDLFFVHTRTGEIGQYDLHGNIVHSLTPGGIFQAPAGNAQISYADRVNLIDTLLKAGGVETIEFTDLAPRDLGKFVDEYVSFMDVTLPGTATLHLKNGGTVLIHVTRGAISIDHVGPAAGAEEDLDSLAREWTEFMRRKQAEGDPFYQEVVNRTPSLWDELRDYDDKGVEDPSAGQRMTGKLRSFLERLLTDQPDGPEEQWEKLIWDLGFWNLVELFDEESVPSDAERFSKILEELRAGKFYRIRESARGKLNVVSDHLRRIQEHFGDPPDAGSLEAALFLSPGQGIEYLEWLRQLEEELQGWTERFDRAFARGLTNPSTAKMRRAIRALQKGTHAQRKRAAEEVGQWQVRPPYDRLLVQALVANRVFSYEDAIAETSYAAEDALIALSESIPPGIVRQELGLRLLVLYLERGIGPFEEVSEYFYSPQLYNLVMKAYRVRYPKAENIKEKAERIGRTVNLAVDTSTVESLGLSRAGFWENIPARHMGDLLGVLETWSQIPVEQVPKPGPLSRELGFSLKLLDALAEGRIYLEVGGQRWPLDKVFPDKATVFLKIAAGAEEKIRRIDAGEFFGEYQPALGTLSSSRRDEIFRWMDYSGFEIREVTLPDRVALYVRGPELMEELSARIGNPPGVSFDWKLLPLKPDEGWERAGLILNDFGRQGVYDLENPNGLKIRDVRSGEAVQLNAALLLAEALAALPPGSVLLGAEMLPDTRGNVRLILFSA